MFSTLFCCFFNRGSLYLELKFNNLEFIKALYGLIYLNITHNFPLLHVENIIFYYLHPNFYIYLYSGSFFHDIYFKAFTFHSIEYFYSLRQKVYNVFFLELKKCKEHFDYYTKTIIKYDDKYEEKPYYFESKNGIYENRKSNAHDINIIKNFSSLPNMSIYDECHFNEKRNFCIPFYCIVEVRSKMKRKTCGVLCLKLDYDQEKNINLFLNCGNLNLDDKFLTLKNEICEKFETL